MQNSTTIRGVHAKNKISVNIYSLQKRLKRAGHSFGLDDELTPKAYGLIIDWYEISENGDNGHSTDIEAPIIADPPIKEEERAPIVDNDQVDETNNDYGNIPFTSPVNTEDLTKNSTKINLLTLAEIIPALSLPMLALSAAYGVYFFAVQFVPPFIAVIEAASFELIYIGLAMIKTSDDGRKYARYVSVGAVGVSIIYNTIAAAIHQKPDLLIDLAPTLRWIISFVHGAPLAVLAYLVSDLLFHRK